MYILWLTLLSPPVSVVLVGNIYLLPKEWNHTGAYNLVYISDAFKVVITRHR